VNTVESIYPADIGSLCRLSDLPSTLNPTMAELTPAIEQEVEKCPAAQRLRTHPGVESPTALAFVLISGKQINHPDSGLRRLSRQPL
jgi:hypothetical protein